MGYFYEGLKAFATTTYCTMVTNQSLNMYNIA